MIRRTLLILAFILGIGHGRAIGGVDPATLAELKAKVKEEGTIRVIVNLPMPYRLEMDLTETKVAEQRLQIQQLQSSIERDLLGMNAKIWARFEYVPGMALEVDAWALEKLATLPSVDSIKEDQPLSPGLVDSTENIGARGVWSDGYAGEGQVVAVIDTGVDRFHPFFGTNGDKIVSEACYSEHFCPGGVYGSTQLGSGDACPADVSGCDHGTHVAGIVAADDEDGDFDGVAPGADIISIQVGSRTDSGCSNSGPCVTIRTMDLIKALERVYALREIFDIAAVNMSIYLKNAPFSDTASCDARDFNLTSTIANLHNSGIAFVGISGNDGFRNAISWPSCITHAISVGATTDSDAVSYSSNVSPLLDLLAPGDQIMSAIPGGGQSTKSGTSMAAPHVAGAIAVLKQIDPSAGPDELLRLLRNNATPVDDTRTSPAGTMQSMPRIGLGSSAKELYRGNPRYHHYDLIDDDGILRPGESAELRVSIVSSNFSIQGPYGVLSAVSPTVTVTDHEALWPNAGVHTVVRPLDTFSLEVSPNHPCGEPIELELELHALMDYTNVPGTWRSTIKIHIGSPDPATIVADDLETYPPSNWTQQSLVGGWAWAYTGFDPIPNYPYAYLENNQDHSPTHSWRIYDLNTASDTVLTLNEIPFLPPNSRLRFKMFMETLSAMEGGVLEISVDSGATWRDAGPFMTRFGYNSRIAPSASLFVGRMAWSGTLGGWHQVEVDLSSFADRDVILRWRFVTLDFDSSPYTYEAWFIDDVVVASITPCDSSPEVFAVNTTFDAADVVPGDGICETGPGNATCSLRAAIQEANARLGQDIVELPAGNYLLNVPGRDEDGSASGDLDVTDTLIINGAGAEVTVIDANRLDRVLDLCPPGSCGFRTAVDLVGITLRNGRDTRQSGNGGGGLRNRAQTLLDHCVVTDNALDYPNQFPGGGIFNEGNLTLNRSAVTENRAFESAGIWTASLVGAGDVTLIESVVSDNVASAGAGGLGGTATDLRVLRSTISQNHAGSFGGGIQVRGSLVLINSTVSGNTAGEDHGAIRVEDDGTSVVIRNSTIAYNSATGGCDGICIDYGDGTVTMANSIVSDGCANLDFGEFVSEGHNIEQGGDTCGLDQPTDLAFTNPRIFALADNGGPTPTHALIWDSPAIDHGDPGGCKDDSATPLTEDQRGVARPLDGDGDFVDVCDAGAFEFVPPIQNLTVTQSGTGTGTVTSDPAGIECGPTCSADFSGTVLLSAAPDAGSAFVGWRGDWDCSDGRVFMFADQTCEAIFELPLELTVNTTADAPDAVRGDGVCETVQGNGVCSLRAAIQESNSTPGPGVIELPAGTFAVSIEGRAEHGGATGDLDITESLTIRGAGESATIIDGNGLDRVFDVCPVQSCGAETTASFKDLTIRGGHTFEEGGGVCFNVPATSCVFDTDCGPGDVCINQCLDDSCFGAGVRTAATTSFEQCTIRDNVVEGSTQDVGGGIAGELSPATLTLIRTSVLENSAFAAGGLFTSGGYDVTLIESTVSGNVATRAGSGGTSTKGALTVIRSLIGDNTSKSDGGGMRIEGGPVVIVNSTISGNFAGENYGGVLLGLDNGESITFLNSTIADNGAENACRGVCIEAGDFDVRFANTIIDNDCGNFDQARFVSLGHNIEFRNTCNLLHPTDRPDTDSQLELLADNGGPTWTHATSPGSPAIDGGDPAGCNDGQTALISDQRGAVRPQDGDENGSVICDVGAFEYGLVCEEYPWYRDQDGDGFGNPNDAVLACLQPAGYVSDGTDCDDTGDVWGTPGIVDLLSAISSELWSWSVPVDPGAASVAYDLLRSATRSDFSAASCPAEQVVETYVTDTAQPNSGEVFYYLVRAVNACPVGGVGSVGLNGVGGFRIVGATCP